MSEIVRLRGVWKVYPGGTTALRGVDLSVEEGEFVGVMGPSGSGKSTLLHIIGGLDTPTEGIAEVFGKNVAGMSEEELTLFRRGRIAYIFQFYYLLEDLTVFENVALIGSILNVPYARRKAEELLEFLRLKDRMSHKPSQLSGGEQQRVAIARALLVKPALILADEPTGNVDQEEGRRIFELFRELSKKEGITFIVATHNPELRQFMDRVVFLRDGEIVETA